MSGQPPCRIAPLKGLCTDATSVKAVISLVHSLGPGVVAEGVETAEQLDFLAANGCDEIQGYLISRPVPQGQFELLLRETLYLPLAAA